MKTNIIRLMAVLVAIGLAFTPFWQWSAPIILVAIISGKQPRDSVMSPTDRFV